MIFELTIYYIPIILPEQYDHLDLSEDNKSLTMGLVVKLIIMYDSACTPQTTDNECC